jgi:hypothetical protein
MTIDSRLVEADRLEKEAKRLRNEAASDVARQLHENLTKALGLWKMLPESKLWTGSDTYYSKNDIYAYIEDAISAVEELYTIH